MKKKKSEEKMIDSLKESFLKVLTSNIVHFIIDLYFCYQFFRISTIVLHRSTDKSVQKNQRQSDRSQITCSRLYPSQIIWNYIHHQ